MTTWLQTSRFRLHPAVLHGQRILAKLETQLDCQVTQWTSWLKEKGLQHREDVDGFLKKEFGWGSIQRRLFIQAAYGEALENYQGDAYFQMASEYVIQQYSGKKEHLRELYAACVEYVVGLGEDVGLSPCKTYVPAYRKRVFAHIIPATQKRIDLGLALGDHPASERLKSTGGFAKGDRITHKVGICDVSDLDPSCLALLQKAYEGDA